MQCFVTLTITLIYAGEQQIADVHALTLFPVPLFIAYVSKIMQTRV